MKTLGRLFGYLKPYWHLVLATLLVSFAGSFFGFIQPEIVRWTIDRAITPGRWDLLFRYSFMYIASALILGAFLAAAAYLTQYVGHKAVYDLRNQLYAHIQKLSFSFFDKAATGDLMSRFTSDVEIVNLFLGAGLVLAVSSVFLLAGAIFMMLSMNVALTLVSLAVLPLLVFSVNRLSTKIRPMFARIQQQMGRITSVLQETLAGLRVVRAFGQEEEESAKFRAENEEYRQRQIRTVRLSTFYNTFMTFTSNMAVALLIWYGGREVLAGTISIGELVAFNQYIFLLVMPVRLFGMLITMVQRALASSQRIFEVLDTSPEIADKPGAVPLPPVEGHVEFDHVSFGYDPSKPILADVSLEALPGQTIAILGGTGSGKSTLIHLIPRFYDVTGGSITVDGRDVRDVTLESLRTQIGIVTQETFLFSDTIRNNIAYGRPDAPIGGIVEAAKAAAIDDFIESLPEKYDTVIGERGVGLSGGQKQRLAIARAIVTGAKIVILDESMSNLDAETEVKIQAAFKDLLKGRTSIVIAQRLSTVRDADQILVLDEGKVVERGRHAELVAAGGIYSQIYNLQFRGKDGAMDLKYGLLRKDVAREKGGEQR
jgi:ATP-binding cassette subfamily B protein